jgi:hypothetical protein
MYQSNHKIKAVFLLLVFALNTVVSFACSFGLVDLLKNHHIASPQPLQEKAHSHDHTSHYHASKAAHQQHGDESTRLVQQPEDQQEKNCCADNAVELSKTDKALPGTYQNPTPLQVAMIAFIHSFLLPDFMVPDLIDPKPPFDRSWDPEHHTNIRIAIQSFQI